MVVVVEGRGEGDDLLKVYMPFENANVIIWVHSSLLFGELQYVKDFEEWRKASFVTLFVLHVFHLFSEW